MMYDDIITLMADELYVYCYVLKIVSISDFNPISKY